MSPLILFAVGVVSLLILRYSFISGRRSRNLPLGPPTIPFIGNLHQIPRAYTHIRFTEWAKQYGGLYTLKIGSGTMAVITDRRIVKELIDKKSNITSDRPPSFVSHDLITKGDHLLIMHYGNKWRTFRRLMHQSLMESVVESDHIRIIDAEAVQLVRDYMLHPDDHMLHPKRFSNSIINSIVFGIRTRDAQDQYMNRLYILMDEFSQMIETGATPPVDIFPWLKQLPQSLFGNYITRAKALGFQMEKLYGDMLDHVIQRRKSGNRAGSFMDRVLDEQKINELPINQQRSIGGVLMEGGSDTTSSLILAIVQALTKSPETQSKAQAEIDITVGQDRSPQWSDRDSLPYVNMIVKEGHRWRPAVPLGFPHALSEDAWIDGKLLPKDTILIVNAWGMHMDDRTYPNSSAFIPERFADHPFLASEYAAGDWERRDHYGYGSGRRICPGIHLAERNLFLAVAKLLWAFRFEEAVPGQDGKMAIPNDSDPLTGYHQGFLYCAKPYGCRPVLRSESIRRTIEREFREAQTVFEKFDEALLKTGGKD